MLPLPGLAANANMVGPNKMDRNLQVSLSQERFFQPYARGTQKPRRGSCAPRQKPRRGPSARRRLSGRGCSGRCGTAGDRPLCPLAFHVAVEKTVWADHRGKRETSLRGFGRDHGRDGEGAAGCGHHHSRPAVSDVTGDVALSWTALLWGSG